MAQQTDAATDAIDHELADAVETWALADSDSSEEFADFIESALAEAEDMLTDNRADAQAMGMLGDDAPTVEEVLSPDNVRDVKWSAPRFKGRRVTVWLRDAPNWANTADQRDFTVGDLNDRDRDVMAVIDVRPF